MTTENAKNKTRRGALDGMANSAHVAVFSHQSDYELRQAIRRMEVELLDRKVRQYRGRPKSSVGEFSQGGALRSGCTIAIYLEDKGWSLDVYAPGYPPFGGEGLLSGYFPRKYGSTGLAVDALIRYGDWRHLLPQMKQAEDAYVATLGSGTTE